MEVEQGLPLAHDSIRVDGQQTKTKRNDEALVVSKVDFAKNRALSFDARRVIF